MVILGISAYHGDCSASIIKDGKLIAAVEEERFQRIKHWAGFPEFSIRYCLKEAKVKLSEVDHIAIARDTRANLNKKIYFILKNPRSWKKLNRIFNRKNTFDSIEDLFSKGFQVDPEEIQPKIRAVEHHIAHLASSYFVNSYSESALISFDGLGDFVSTMYAIGKNNNINVLKKIYSPHSIGIFYSMITQFLGFNKYGDEYKVMGLASYGKPEYLDDMEDLISYKGEGDFKLNLTYYQHHRKEMNFNWNTGKPDTPIIFSDDFIKRFGKPRSFDEPVTNFHKNFAASMQRHTENIIFKIMDYVYKQTGIKNLSLSGGVAMNSVMNGKILKRSPFKNIYIPPVAGDAGTSMGAAFYVWNQLLDKPKDFILDHGYWGPEYSSSEIKKTIEKYQEQLNKDEFHVNFDVKEDELINRTVDYIIEGKVIGWFHGRMEFGARALGNRSIVVDPRRHDMKSILNDRIKKREEFRPFAPSILLEKVPEWFEESDPVPFMEKVYIIKEEKRSLIPAVTHIDGTGRLQTVSRKQNRLYYKLIETFEKKTGIPIILNTSFNENEPIVCTPKEALEAFLRTKMDVVVLKDCIITRK